MVGVKAKDNASSLSWRRGYCGPVHNTGDCEAGVSGYWDVPLARRSLASPPESLASLFAEHVKEVC